MTTLPDIRVMFSRLAQRVRSFSEKTGATAASGGSTAEPSFRPSRFRYPPMIVEHVRDEWKQGAWHWELQVPDLPNDEVLLELLEVAYHASFTTEERRRTSVRIAFAEPNSQPHALMLQQPRPFSVSEVMRLAPTANLHETALGVFGHSSRDLQIWGIVREPKGDVPVFGTSAPGSIALTCWGRLVVRLHQGDLSAPTVDEMLIVQTFPKAVDELLNELTGPPPHWEPSYYYAEPLLAALGLVSDEGHGGTIFVFPDAMWDSKNWRDLFNIKYPVHDARMWPSMLRVMQGRGDPSTRGQDTPEKRMLVEWPTQIAALTRVDGAVLMTDRYRILGFGAEVVVRSGVVDLKTGDGHTRNVYDYGTRHRSAFRLCDAQPEFVGFICSQDGGIKCIRKLDGVLTLWT